MTKLNAKTEKKQLKYRERNLYKAVIARSDIYAAHNACILFMEHVKDIGSPFYLPLLNAIVISYSRPYSENRPHGPLSKKWNKFSKEEHNKVHREILNLRDKVIAHSDKELRKVYLYPESKKIEETEIISESISVAATIEVAYIQTIKIIYEMTIDLIDRLSKWIDEDIEYLYDIEKPLKEVTEITI